MKFVVRVPYDPFGITVGMTSVAEHPYKHGDPTGKGLRCCAEPRESG